MTMSPRKVMSILSGAFSHMRPTGSFYQFTYGPRCPVPRRGVTDSAHQMLLVAEALDALGLRR